MPFAESLAGASGWCDFRQSNTPSTATGVRVVVAPHRWRTARGCVLFALGLAALAGCGDSGENEDQSSGRPSRSSPDGPDSGLSEGRVSETVNSEERRYEGLTLPEWRARIQQIQFDAPSAADAVPGLIEIVRDGDVPWYTRRQAALTLGRIGEPAEEAVSVFVALLEEPTEADDASTQLWSIKALALFGPVARDATPALIEVLQSELQPHLVRLSTLEALGRIGPEHSQTLPAIIGALQVAPAEDDAVEAERLERRVAAAEILELFRGHAAPAVPALNSACTDESVLLRRAAVNTLGVIGPPAETALPTLIDRLLFDESEDVRDRAARALAGIGPAAEPYLRQLLQDRDVDIRWRAAEALGELNGLDPSTLEALEAALTDDFPRVRLLAAAAVWNATGESTLIMTTVVAELAHPEREARMQSVRILEQIGPTSQFGRNELQSLIESGDSGSRQAARRVLRSWDNTAAQQ